MKPLELLLFILFMGLMPLVVIQLVSHLRRATPTTLDDWLRSTARLDLDYAGVEAWLETRVDPVELPIGEVALALSRAPFLHGGLAGQDMMERVAGDERIRAARRIFAKVPRLTVVSATRDKRGWTRVFTLSSRDETFRLVSRAEWHCSAAGTAVPFLTLAIEQ